MLVLLFVPWWFVMQGSMFWVLPSVVLFLCFSVLWALRLPRLGKRELILVLFVCLFDLSLFGFVCFLILLVSGKGCDLWWWHSLDFSFTFFFGFRLYEFKNSQPLLTKPWHRGMLTCNRLLFKLWYYSMSSHCCGSRYQMWESCYCLFNICRKDVFCLAFYFKWKYFVPNDHFLSETICLFCFCVLFSNIYPKIKFTTKN